MKKYKWMLYDKIIIASVHHNDNGTEGVVYAKTSREARRKVTKESGIRRWGRWRRRKVMGIDAREFPYFSPSYEKVNPNNDMEILLMWEVKE